MEITMPDETLPTTETVAPAAQAAAVTESPTEEAFDKERALRTIHAQREEMKEAKAQLKELAALKAEAAKRAEAEMTEAERLKKQADEAQQENARLKSDILRRDVVAETGLPAIFADRLKGDTKEAMLADAQEIMKALPQNKVNPKVPATNPANGEMVESDAQKRARLFGTQNNVFDLKAIEANGGGVVWNTKP
jgi:hypothetical protein